MYIFKPFKEPVLQHLKNLSYKERELITLHDFKAVISIINSKSMVKYEGAGFNL